MADAASDQNLIEVQHIGKAYGGVQALSDVTLGIATAQVHALCGENGAGKSTLIKILSGSVMPDTGTVLVAGEPLRLGSVAQSEAAGIAVIHQELVAFPHLNAQDNIFVGREPKRLAGLWLDRAQMRRRTRALLDRLGESFSLDEPVGQLPVAQRQMVGIARALSHNCRLLIMDEPTASLSSRETDVLFRIVRQLKTDGVSILYISHRLEEIFELSDRVTVFRDGRWVATTPTPQIDRAGLIRQMVGREVLAQRAAARPPQQGPAVLQVANLSRQGAFADISFTVRPGEIVGMAGLVGAGRSEVARCIFGADSPDSGTVTIDGVPLSPGSIAAAMRAGVALVPEDRQNLGLVLPMTVRQNLSMAVLPTLQHWGLISSSGEQNLAKRLIAQLTVKTASAEVPAQTLSGGNQQKLVLGKWLASKPHVLILDEPTRGVDVGAKAEIYKLIHELAADGIAVLLISSDLPEILLMSDRILVMCRGQISGQLLGAQATQEQVLALAIPSTATEVAS